MPNDKGQRGRTARPVRTRGGGRRADDPARQAPRLRAADGPTRLAVDTAALLDPQANDAAVAATVEDVGEKGLTGGVIADAADRVCLALQESNAIGRRDRDGRSTVLAVDPRLLRT